MLIEILGNLGVGSEAIAIELIDGISRHDRCTRLLLTTDAHIGVSIRALKGFKSREILNLSLGVARLPQLAFEPERSCLHVPADVGG
jgi:hypothetical protein